MGRRSTPNSAVNAEQLCNEARLTFTDFLVEVYLQPRQAHHGHMVQFLVGGEMLEPFTYRRVSENGRRGLASLVVCTNGDCWWQRSDDRRVPARPGHVKYIFKREPQGTSVVKEPPPY